MIYGRNAMITIVCTLWKRHCLLLLLALVLLCGCGSLSTSEPAPTPTIVVQQPTPAPTIAVQQPAPTPTPAVQQSAPTPTPAVQPAFTSYVGKWQVHDELLTINTNYTGLELWNAGPCSNQMCNGNAHLTLTENMDGSLKATIQSVSYIQWNGNPAPTGFQPTTDPRAGDTFQLQHSGVHLLYTTWFGARLSFLNTSNRYWCDSYALTTPGNPCGA
jgi:hypothetical protein